MNTTDQESLAALEALAHDGVVAISSRHLAEHIGRTRETASKSLGRLVTGGYIEIVRAGRGVQSARYRVLSSPEKPAQKPDNNTTPGGATRASVTSSEARTCMVLAASLRRLQRAWR
ncbi:hypothetical protein PJ267_09235 [Arthrobacter sp. OVS8]|nr:hypothetical protein PJ267_09235 [Arthrobacter sp. OVS8]